MVNDLLPVSWRRSLWVRLALVIAVSLVVVLGLFVWIASRVLTTSAIRTGRERALNAATQVATAIGQNTARGMIEVQRLTADGLLLEYLARPTPALADRVRQRLRLVVPPGQPPTVLFNELGASLLEIRAVEPGVGAGSGPATGAASLESRARAVLVPPPSTVPSYVGVGPLQAVQGVIFADVVVEIRASSDDSQDAERMGTLVIRRVIQAGANADIVNRLVGTGAVAAIGNRAGPPWTDFTQMLDVPPMDATQRTSGTYPAADGTARVGGVAPVDGTSWAVWIDLPQSVVVAPLQAVVRRMALVALATALVASLAVGWVVARAIKPLNDLAVATEAIAAGDYARRVSTTRADEIGRLGAAFNAMTDRVAHTHQELERRVEERTRTLEQARHELDQFFALSPDMLRISGPGGNVLRINDAWHDVLGWDLDYMAAEPSISFVHPDDRDKTLEAREELRRVGARTTFENRYRTKDGTYRWLQWRAVAVPERQTIYSAARDVTEDKRIAAELERRATELAALNTELEMFSYSVSHDLRAPLRHVQGFAALLAKSPTAKLAETDRRWLATIDAAAMRMARLIDDLLTLSRTGRAALRKTPVAVATLIREARDELITDPNSARVTWVIDDLPTVVADPSLLRLVFVNLLSNALKYTRLQPDAVITIGTAPGGDGESVVFVRDNGVGFDMKYADKLFGVFQRLHADTQFEGTGIGLANVRRIVQRHGGRTWAEAEVDRGATFFVALPSA